MADPPSRISHLASPSNLASHSVLIVGAGPTGLVLALWLAKAGIRVRIIDRLAEPGTTSRALAVQARTLEFYRQLGIAEAVVEAGRKIAGINLHTGVTTAARLELAMMGEGLSPFPFPLIYPQDEHEQLLIEQLAQIGVQVERPVELVRFEQQADQVTAVLRHADGREEICITEYLAGCDGAHSIVRKSLGTGFPGSTYSGVFYVADVEATGTVVDNDVHVEIEAADFVAIFPLKKDGHLRLIGPVTWTAETEESNLTFEQVRIQSIEAMALKVNRVNWFSTYRVHHRVADHFRDRRAFLLGDAAHVHSPVGGQGMNTGIGDAVNLAWKLAAVIKGESGDALLSTYESERIGFAQQLVASTDRAFTLIISQGRFARLMRTRIVPKIARFLVRLPRVRHALFRTLSQIGVSYRDSALSAGSAGPLHGGDRLPWIELEAGKDNFLPLTTRDWQMHVYGDVDAKVQQVCDEFSTALHAFAWQPSMRRAGLRRSTLYLVRPDGYLGFVDAEGSVEKLREYLRAQQKMNEK